MEENGSVFKRFGGEMREIRVEEDEALSRVWRWRRKKRENEVLGSSWAFIVWALGWLKWDTQRTKSRAYNKVRIEPKSKSNDEVQVEPIKAKANRVYVEPARTKANRVRVEPVEVKTNRQVV